MLGSKGRKVERDASHYIHIGTDRQSSFSTIHHSVKSILIQTLAGRQAIAKYTIFAFVFAMRVFLSSGIYARQ